MLFLLEIKAVMDQGQKLYVCKTIIQDMEGRILIGTPYGVTTPPFTVSSEERSAGPKQTSMLQAYNSWLLFTFLHDMATSEAISNTMNAPNTYIIIEKAELCPLYSIYK